MWRNCDTHTYMQYVDGKDAGMKSFIHTYTYIIHSYIHTYTHTHTVSRWKRRGNRIFHTYINTYIIPSYIHTYIHTHTHTQYLDGKDAGIESFMEPLLLLMTYCKCMCVYVCMYVNARMYMDMVESFMQPLLLMTYCKCMCVLMYVCTHASVYGHALNLTCSCHAISPYMWYVCICANAYIYCSSDLKWLLMA